MEAIGRRGLFRSARGRIALVLAAGMTIVAPLSLGAGGTPAAYGLCKTKSNAHCSPSTTTTTSSTTTTTAPLSGGTSSTTTTTTAPTTTTTTTTTTAPPGSTTTPGSSILWGAWIGSQYTGTEAPWSVSAIDDVQNEVGKGLSLVNFSSPFATSSGSYYNFDSTAFSNVRNYGAIPFFSWGSTPYSDSQVASGGEDGYITNWAQAAKNWGHPMFLRFDWEMNGSWFPWGVGNNGNTAASYVAMWQHVHNVFASVGATNVTWVWCPNTDPGNQMTSMSSVYPGDAYVDWSCLDGYNGANPWSSFGQLFSSSYNTITGSVAPSKPMIIGETASTESGGSKASWITDMLTSLPTSYPQIKGFLWFDKIESGPGGHTDWPLDSSSTSLAAFASGIQSSTYTSNTYSSLAASPIPPP